MFDNVTWGFCSLALCYACFAVLPLSAPFPHRKAMIKLGKGYLPLTMVIVVALTQDHPFQVNEFPVSFDVSRDGSFVISGSSNGSVVCYKTNNGNYMRSVPLSSKDPDSCVALQCHPVLPSAVAVSDWSGTIHVMT